MERHQKRRLRHRYGERRLSIKIIRRQHKRGNMYHHQCVVWLGNENGEIEHGSKRQHGSVISETETKAKALISNQQHGRKMSINVAKNEHRKHGINGDIIISSDNEISANIEESGSAQQ